MRFPLALRSTVDRLETENDRLKGHLTRALEDGGKLTKQKNAAVTRLLQISHQAVAERMRHKYATVMDENGDIHPACRDCDTYRSIRKAAEGVYETD